MAGTIKANVVQLGDSATATQNFVLQTNVDGTAKRARGNQGATTQDLLTVAADGNVQLTKTTGQSMIRLNSTNGAGSTNTVIRRWLTTVTSQGTDITYADSATLGGTFTINTNGVYAIEYHDGNSAGAGTRGISLNSTQLTTAILSLTNQSEVLAMATTPTANYIGCASWIGYLAVGSIIRAHTEAATTLTTQAQAAFTITRVA